VSIIFSVIAIVAIIIMGAILLTLLGIVLSLGHYDKEEVRARLKGKHSDPDRWHESANWG